MEGVINGMDREYFNAVSRVNELDESPDVRSMLYLVLTVQLYQKETGINLLEMAFDEAIDFFLSPVEA